MRIADYVRRGRRYESLPLEELRTLYIGLVDERARDLSKLSDSADMDDAAAELSVRRESVPADALKEARKTLIANMKALIEVEKSNPQRVIELGHKIIAGAQSLGRQDDEKSN